MDIRNYIPKGISALEPPDEQLELTASGDVVDVVVSSTSVSLAQPLRCFICSGQITSQAQDYYRPCLCNKDVAHIQCALRDNYWQKNHCTTCHNSLIAPQPPSKPPRKGILKKMTSLPHCALCNNVRFQDEKTVKYDARFIRPCFCDIVTHHGCMAEMVVHNAPVCRVCGVEYKVYKYGSFADFLVRYAWQYGLFSLLALSIFLVSLICLYKAFSHSGPITFIQILIIVIGVILFLLTFLLVSFCVHHTVKVRLPRFRIRFGQVNVIDYEPTAYMNSAVPGGKRNALMSQMNRKPPAGRLSGGGMAMEVARGSPEAVELAHCAEEGMQEEDEDLEAFETTRRPAARLPFAASRKSSNMTEGPSTMLANGEISLGQYLFDHKSSNSDLTSSTPIRPFKVLASENGDEQKQAEEELRTKEMKAGGEAIANI